MTLIVSNCRLVAREPYPELIKEPLDEMFGLYADMTWAHRFRDTEVPE